MSSPTITITGSVWNVEGKALAGEIHIGCDSQIVDGKIFAASSTGFEIGKDGRICIELPQGLTVHIEVNGLDEQSPAFSKIVTLPRKTSIDLAELLASVDEPERF